MSVNTTSFKVGDWVKLLPDIWERNKCFPAWTPLKDKAFLVIKIEYGSLFLQDFVQPQIFACYFELAAPSINDMFSLDKIEA